MIQEKRYRREDVNKYILKVDNDSRILDFKLSNGMSCWLLTRYYIFRLLNSKTCFLPQFEGRPSSGKRKSIKRPIENLIQIFKILTKDPLRVRKHYDCINFCIDLGMFETPEGKRASRSSGFLNDVESITTLHVISRNDESFLSNYLGDYCYSDGLKRRLLSSSSRRAVRVEHATFINYVQTLLNNALSKEDEISIARSLAFAEFSSPLFEKRIRKFFLRVNPKLVIIEEANYGDVFAVTIISVARSLGIKTAEMQHGLFDIAFSYGTGLSKQSDFVNHKTDFILTFGDYFSNFVKKNYKTFTIGNYLLEQKKNSIRLWPRTNLKTILFVTQINYTYPIVPILREALERLEEKFSLVIRLHPLEGKDDSRYKSLLNYPSYISTTDDIYSLLANSDYIVGSCSTSLLEASIFSKNPLIYHSDISEAYIPSEYGERFSNSDELYNLLVKEFSPKALVNRYFSTEGCVANFERFYWSYVQSSDNDC